MRSLAALAMLLAALSPICEGIQQTRELPTGQSPYHLEIAVLPYGSTDATRPPRLSAADFRVSQNGRGVRFRVAQAESSLAKAGLRPHLLVLLPDGASRPEDSQVMRALHPVLSKKWLVSVSRAGGGFTGYRATSSSLASALQSHSRVLSASPASATGLDAAMFALSSFAGRRALLIVLPPASEPPAFLTTERRVLRQIYIVDGGIQVAIAGYNSLAPNPGDPSSIPLSETSVTTRNLQMIDYDGDGVVHEITLKGAVKDVIKDSSSFYDLDLDLPEAGPVQIAPISLVLRYQGAWVASADLYKVLPGFANGRIALKREPLSGYLTVERSR